MKKLHQEILHFVIGGAIGVVGLAGIFWKITQGRAIPNVMVAGVEVGGLTEKEIQTRLMEVTAEYQVRLEYGESGLEVPKTVLEYELESTARKAVGIGKGGILSWWKVLTGQREIEIEVKLNETEWESYLEELRGLVQIAATPNELTLFNKQVKFVNGTDGVELDEARVTDEMVRVASRLITLPLPLKTNEIKQALSQEEQDILIAKAEKLVGDELIIQITDGEARLGDEELVSLVSSSPETLGEVSQEKLEGYVLGLMERYEREPQDAVLQFVEGRVNEFVPALDGIKISKQNAVDRIRGGVEKLLEDGVEDTEIEIVVERVSPEISTESVNDLGIVERIGRGESYYAHSIPNRVYNVGLAARRVSGALVAPGEEFSFNNQVGEISGATGYRSAYVISEGRTILGDGGGVCQVSTTVFRAALNAGLSITERWAHAYRVGYYEQNAKAGFDATIYSPSKDLKFLNDTPGYILVQAIVDEPNRHLIIDVYGTKDGRVALISPARVWDVSPPPPDLYQDDGSLAKGVVKQVDWAAWGAKAAFDYRVEREGETIFSKTFSSSYRPWQNVYLSGTGTQ